MFGLAFIAAVQAAASGEPGDRPFDDPAVAAQPGGGLDALGGDAVTDAFLTEPSAQVVVVVALVGMELGWTPAARSAAGADGRDPAHEWFQSEAVVHVGAGDAQGQGQPVAVRDQVDFRSALASIGRIRSGQWPPFAALTLTESIAHRDQSNAPRAPSSSRMTRCSLAHTRSRLHWAKRR